MNIKKLKLWKKPQGLTGLFAQGESWPREERGPSSRWCSGQWELVAPLWTLSNSTRSRPARVIGWTLFSLSGPSALPIRIFRCSVSNRAAASLDDQSKAFAALIDRFILQLNGRAFRNGGRWLVGFLLRTIQVTDRLSRSRCALTAYFVKVCVRRYRSEGMKGLVLWLKASYVIIQQATAGYIIRDTSPLKRRVRRQGGFPKWIPPFQRALMRRGDITAIRFWTSLTSLYRILSFPAAPSVTSIVAPGCNWEEILGSEGDQDLNSVIDRFWAVLGLEKLRQDWERVRMRAFPILRSSPVTMEWWVEPDGPLRFSGLKLKKRRWKATVSSAWGPVGHSAYALMNVFPDILQNISTFIWGQRDMAEFLGSLRRSSWFTGSRPLYSKVDLAGTGLAHPDIKDDVHFGPLGRLGLKDEPAGKVRVFAMVDPWTQWAMYPLHSFLQKILRTISSDATFDQIGVVEDRLAEEMLKFHRVPKAFSYDLSSATDRLPISLQIRLLTPLLGLEKAKAWANVLVGRDYSLPASAQASAGCEHVRYAVGQPMGALSSWCMLALTHHLIVQWAASRADELKFSWFDAYVVLGDDIVIFSPKVAREYLNIMRLLGVEVGLAKSLVSRNAYTFEFAKKLWVNGYRCFVIPLRDCIVSILSTQTMSEFMRKHNYSFNSYLKLRGLGFKARSKWAGPLWSMSTRLRVYAVLYMRDKMDFVQWVAAKSLTTSYSINREIMLQMCVELGKDIEDLLKRLSNPKSSQYNPDLWRDPEKVSSWLGFDLFRYPWSGIPDLVMRIERFSQWLRLMKLQIAGELSSTPIDTFSEAGLMSFISRLISLYNQLEEKASQIPTSSLLTVCRFEERDFSDVIRAYKRWVRYNRLFVQAEQPSAPQKPEPVPSVGNLTEAEIMAKVDQYWAWKRSKTLSKLKTSQRIPIDFFSRNVPFIWKPILSWDWIHFRISSWWASVTDFMASFTYGFIGMWALLCYWWPVESHSDHYDFDWFSPGPSTDVPGIPPVQSVEDIPIPFNLFDWWLAFLLGFFIPVLFVQFLPILVGDELRSLVELIWEMASWEGVEESVVAEVPVRSVFRFPTFQELIDWQQSTSPPATFRSPQIGHGWSELWSQQTDWPEAWR